MWALRGVSSAGLERLPVTQKVEGSSPFTPAIEYEGPFGALFSLFSKHLQEFVTRDVPDVPQSGRRRRSRRMSDEMCISHFTNPLPFPMFFPKIEFSIALKRII